MPILSVISPPIRFRTWLLAARPKTLPAALAPVIVGSALAYGDGVFALLPALAAAAGALLLQIGSNFANDYFDFVKGADTHDRLGPPRATASGLITPETMRSGMVVIFVAAALIGLYLVWIGGWPILAVGAAAIIAALAYTGGPLPFGYVGLGDFFVFLFFGPVAVCGTYYVQALALHESVALASVPVGALITAILVINNLRDIETDRRAGKYTLAVLLGRRAVQIEYLALLGIAYVVPLVVWLWGRWPVWTLLAWATLPLAYSLARAVFVTASGVMLNQTLAGTARCSLLYSLCLSIGLIL
jgi:1,4-dihydroxy-2-naphthoate octaprenyltransferase